MGLKFTEYPGGPEEFHWLCAPGHLLFSDTIRENIAFGKRDATDKEIEEAARLAQIYD